MGKERERTRICSKVDALPEDARKKLDEMLMKTGNDYMRYDEIAIEITALGYPLSKSAIGRYAIRNNTAIKRLKDARLKTEMLLEAVKDNKDIEATELATTMFVDQLVQKMAIAEEEIQDMPIEKAAKLMVAIQRSNVYKEKYKKQYTQGIEDYKKAWIQELGKELREKEPELFDKICRIADDVKTKAGGSSG